MIELKIIKTVAEKGIIELYLESEKKEIFKTQLHIPSVILRVRLYNYLKNLKQNLERNKRRVERLKFKQKAK